MINHFVVLYCQDKRDKNKKLLPIDSNFVEKCIDLYVDKTGNKPNVGYGSVPLDKELEIVYTIDEKIEPFYLYLGERERLS